jgi:hypothetical protein
MTDALETLQYIETQYEGTDAKVLQLAQALRLEQSNNRLRGSNNASPWPVSPETKLGRIMDSEAK